MKDRRIACRGTQLQLSGEKSGGQEKSVWAPDISMTDIDISWEQKGEELADVDSAGLHQHVAMPSQQQCGWLGHR